MLTSLFHCFSNRLRGKRPGLKNTTEGCNYLSYFISRAGHTSRRKKRNGNSLSCMSLLPLLSHIRQGCFSKTRPTTACHYYIVLTHPTHPFPEFYFYDPGTRNDNGNTLPTSGHIISSDIRRSFRSTATPRKSGYESGKKNDPTLCGNL